jgi:hypothetical protein
MDLLDDLVREIFKAEDRDPAFYSRIYDNQHSRALLPPPQSVHVLNYLSVGEALGTELVSFTRWVGEACHYRLRSERGTWMVISDANTPIIPRRRRNGCYMGTRSRSSL